MLKAILTLILLLVIGVVGSGYAIYAYLSPEEESLPILASPSSVRQLDSGEIIGFQGKNNVHAWLGVPYAEPPIGLLRWKAPRAPEAWQGRYEALETGSRCIQKRSIQRDNQSPVWGSEDCLFLNIWAPPYTAENVPSGDQSLPVMFWIHGGGNSIGEASTAIYDGSLLVKTHKVIVVSLNYRMGPMGWFAHDSLGGEDASLEDRSGNYGTLDIVEGLRWVQRNISKFGGNPDNITIFGESAGAFNVLSMMASPLAEGLFHRAISQSGGLTLTDMTTAKNYQDDPEPGSPYSSGELLLHTLIDAGEVPDREAAKQRVAGMSKDEVKAWLLTRTPEQVFSLYDAFFFGMIPGPTVLADGHVLPANISLAELFSNTELYNNVPVILGTNRDEMKLFSMNSHDGVDKIQNIPSGFNDLEAYNRDTGYQSDLWKLRGVDALARELREAQGDNVFAYRFDADDWRNLGLVDLKDLVGASHAMELFFVFGYFPDPVRFIFPDSTMDAIQLLSQSMMSYWAEFAYHGNPGRGRSGEEELWQAWQNVDAETNRLLLLDTEIDGGIRMSSMQLSLADIKQAFMDDLTYDGVEAKCKAYQRLFRQEQFLEAETLALGCPDLKVTSGF